MGEAKRRQKLDPNFGKKPSPQLEAMGRKEKKEKIVIKKEGIFLIDVEDLDDLVVEHNSAKYTVEATLITWREALEILDKQQGKTTNPLDDGFTEEL